MRHRRRIFRHIPLSLLAALWLIFNSCALTGQTCSGGGSIDPQNWRRVPAQAHRDTMSATVRSLRDANWNKLLPPADWPERPQIDLDYIVGSTIDPALLAAETPGYKPLKDANLPPFDPSIFWVEATFTDYDVFETSTKKIYTEAHMRIVRNFGGHPRTDAPQPGSVIDLGIEGGCLVTAKGEIHNSLTSVYQNEIRPGHTYLLELSHVSSGVFYRRIELIADVTSGVAEPASPRRREEAAAGAWRFAGMTTDDAIKLLERIDARNN